MRPWPKVVRWQCAHCNHIHKLTKREMMRDECDGCHQPRELAKNGRYCDGFEGLWVVPEGYLPIKEDDL